MLSAGPGLAGSEYCSLVSAWETTSEVLCLVLGSPVQERHGHTGASPLEGHQDAQRAAAEDVREELERSGTVQMKRRSLGDLTA